MKDFVPVFFKDFGKAVTDVLKPSKFELGRQVEIKTKSEKSKVGFTVSSNLIEDAATGKLVIKSSCKPHGDVETELHSSGKIAGKFTTTKLADGLKLVATSDFVPSKSSHSHGLDASYSRNHVALTSAVSTTKFSDYSYTGSASVGAAGLSVGALVKVNNGDVADYAAGAQYADDDFVLTVKALNKADKIVASYSHAVNKNSSVVSSFSYGLSKESAGVQNMSVGGTHRVCPESKVTAMYTTNGQLSTVYETSVRPNVVVSIGSVLNINDMSQHALGFKLSLGA